MSETSKPDLKVLIVEDEVIVSTLIEDTLENYGYTVVGKATNGADAIRITDETLPDIILMDIYIEGDMDGIMTAETISEKHDIPIVYLTAYSDRETIERAIKTKPFGYMIKPFTPVELYASLEAVINKHRFYQAREEIRKRERILDAVNSAADCFLKASNFRECIPLALPALGEAGGVSRMIIFENMTDESSPDLMARVVYLWDSQGEKNPAFFREGSMISYKDYGLERWMNEMGRGEIISSCNNDLDNKERLIFDKEGVECILSVPIYSGEEWWGFIILEAINRDNYLNQPEIDAFRTAASIIGSAVYRQRTDESLLAYIREGTIRLKQPVEILVNNMNEIKEDIKNDIPPELLNSKILVQKKTLEQILENLRDLNKAIVEKQKDIPKAYREFFTE